MSIFAETPWPALREAALAATARAYVPYSHVRVGAAGWTSTGIIVTGANIENASYGLTLCAECSLVSDLHRVQGERLLAVSVVGSDGQPMAPCGRCRQLLFEFGGTALAIDQGESPPTTLGALLPDAFGPYDVATRRSDQ